LEVVVELARQVEIIMMLQTPVPEVQDLPFLYSPLLEDPPQDGLAAAAAAVMDFRDKEGLEDLEEEEMVEEMDLVYQLHQDHPIPVAEVEEDIITSLAYQEAQA
jgi:hypothetical protein